MTEFNFTMSMEEIQELIEKKVEDDFAKIMLTKIFNKVMEQQRDHYVGVGDYKRSENRVSHRNGYYAREYKTRVGTLELRVPRTRDGIFSPDIFERYQREISIYQDHFGN